MMFEGSEIGSRDSLIQVKLNAIIAMQVTTDRSPDAHVRNHAQKQAICLDVSTYNTTKHPK